MGFTKVLAGMALFALLYSPACVFSASAQPSNSVKLAWNPSPSPTVVGYRIYYGGFSGNYTNSVTVGNVTSYTISNLISGATYFFAITAYDANGVESAFSNEIAYTVGCDVQASESTSVALATDGRQCKMQDCNGGKVADCIIGKSPFASAIHNFPKMSGPKDQPQTVWLWLKWKIKNDVQRNKDYVIKNFSQKRSG